MTNDMQWLLPSCLRGRPIFVPCAVQLQGKGDGLYVDIDTGHSGLRYQHLCCPSCPPAGYHIKAHAYSDSELE